MAATKLAEERLNAGDLLPDTDHPRAVKITTCESPAVDTDLNRYIGVTIDASLDSTKRTSSCPDDLKTAIQDAGGSHQGSDWEWGIAH